MPASKSIPSTDIQTAIERLITGIGERHPADAKLLLLGIANGGILLAQRIGAKLKNARVGTLDISFHRDDIGRNPIPKEFAPTQIPVDVNGATVILIDDVLFSGRTVKAALNELFDHGRPAKVELAVLVDRGGRRLPFAADYTGLVVPTTDRQKVVVSLHHNAPALDAISIQPAS